MNDDSRDAITQQARNALGSRLREIRESRGMTQTAVARQAGLSRSYYAQVEHARQAISVDRAFALANVLGVEMTELFTAFPAVPHARPYSLTPATPVRDPGTRSPVALTPACMPKRTQMPITVPRTRQPACPDRSRRQIVVTRDAKLAAQSHRYHNHPVSALMGHAAQQ